MSIKPNKWMAPRNLLGLCAFLLSLQALGNEVSIQDAWIRTQASGQDAMAGMVISSTKPARITSAISPAYKFVALQGPGKGGANKIQEIEFIALPAQKPVMLGADGMHLLLSGNKQTLGATEKVPVILTVQFDDKTSKTITIMAQPVTSKGASILPASTAAAPAIPAEPAVAEPSAKADTPVASSKAKPAAAEAPSKPAAPHKAPVAEAKPAKAAPVAAAKTPAHHVAEPAPVSVPVPVIAPVAVAPVAAPVVEPKKAPEIKAAEQPKEDPRTSAECLNLAMEIRECEKANEMMQDWCISNAKSNSACKLPLDQVRTLKKP